LKNSHGIKDWAEWAICRTNIYVERWKTNNICPMFIKNWRRPPHKKNKMNIHI
jgi:hypothetical protein